VLAAAADLGIGLPMDHGLRTILVAMELTDLTGLDVEQREDLFYLTLLRMAGCTVESSSLAFHFGDEVRFGADSQALDYGNYKEFGAWVQTHFAADQDASTREQMLQRLFQYTPSKRREKIAGHCEVARLLAAEMGLGAGVQDGLNFVFERWDGNGAPNQTPGEDIPLNARIMHPVERARGPRPLVRTGGRHQNGRAAHWRSIRSLSGPTDVPRIRARARGA
jgi:hypothetical protein